MQGISLIVELYAILSTMMGEIWLSIYVSNLGFHVTVRTTVHPPDVINQNRKRVTSMGNGKMKNGNNPKLEMKLPIGRVHLREN